MRSPIPPAVFPRYYAVRLLLLPVDGTWSLNLLFMIINYSDFTIRAKLSIHLTNSQGIIGSIISVPIRDKKNVNSCCISSNAFISYRKKNRIVSLNFTILRSLYLEKRTVKKIRPKYPRHR